MSFQLQQTPQLGRNERRDRAIPFFVALALVLVVAGCDARDSGPTTYSLTGHVRLNNEPVAGAVIDFHPQDDGGAMSATAVTDEHGAFSAITYFDHGRQEKPGIVPGDYAITVIRLDPAPPTAPGSPPKNLLPEKYATPASSGLKCTVTTDGPNQCNLDL